MTDTDARIKLTREIERAADSFGRPLPAGLAAYITSRLLQDMPALIDTIKLSSRGPVK